MIYIRSILGANENHCTMCFELAMKGWMPMEQFIPVGSRYCRENCKCSEDYIEIPDVITGPQSQLSKLPDKRPLSKKTQQKRRGELRRDLKSRQATEMQMLQQKIQEIQLAQIPNAQAHIDQLVRRMEIRWAQQRSQLETTIKRFYSG